MHDPMVVAFEIRRPWPQRQARAFGDARWRFRGAFWNIAGRGFYWPGLITIWHVEPGGHDSGEVCKHMRRWEDDFGWHGKPLHGWKWHPHHWKIQIRPLQHLRRWALTRCEWCGGKSRKGDLVNCSKQWDRAPGHWWRGETGLFHEGCTSIHEAHMACLCADGIYESELSGWGYGQCLKCGKRREWRSDERRDSPIDEARRVLASIPPGERDAEKTAAVRAMWKAHRAETNEETTT